MISRSLLTVSIVLFGLFSFVTHAVAQQRDHLTPQEVDLVKDAQMLDKRIDVFIKATERRIMVINGSGAAVANAKQLKKDSEKGWGELPTGSRAELVSDIAKILDEAITNIDDVSARDERNPLIAKSLRKLAQATNTIMSQLKPLATEAKSEAEVASFELLNEDAQSIMEAANKLPPEVVTDKKDKKKSN
jgi:acyl-CoA reductase-like NAD-dependent aldehyde dehydrogenase